MLKEERMKVLEMLKENLISVEDAEKLLKALDNNEGIEVTPKKSFKMLKIFVDSNDGDEVRIQIPIEFAKLLKTDKFNVNLGNSDIDVDLILEMIESGAVGELINIDSADGDKVIIKVE